MSESTYDLINWEEHFKIDENSPSGLLRIKNRVGKDIEGYPVGTKSFYKKDIPMSWCVRFQCKNYLVHRVIWVLAYNSIASDLVIDHLDGNPFNNKLSNLRLTTQKENLRNRRQLKNNTTGTTGVGFTKMNANVDSYYTACWYDINGRPKKKHFSIDKLGEETAKALAIAYREDQISKLILEGAEYTLRHGV